MIQFYCYRKCGTCQKAQKFLNNHEIPYEFVDITQTSFTSETIKQFHLMSGKELKKLFNTNGTLYKELHVKDKISAMSHEEIYALLATDGFLIKRPVLVHEDRVLIGFNEDEYETLIGKMKH